MEIAILFALIVLNGLFAMSEISLVTARKDVAWHGCAWRHSCGRTCRGVGYRHRVVPDIVQAVVGEGPHLAESGYLCRAAV